jgi:hypothetical protein
MSDSHPEPAAPTPPRRRILVAWIGLWTILALLALALVFSRRDEPTGVKRPENDRWRAMLASIRDGDPHPIHDPQRYVWDAVCFVRPRPYTILELSVGPVGGGPQVPYRLVHIEHGLVRPAPLPEARNKPIVLMIGDSHLYGFTDITHNAATLVEASLTSEDEPAALVVNASCPYYSPYQYTLRARTLWNVLAPRVVVATVFVGNDFVELEDTSRPHLDDRLQEQPPSPDPPRETTSGRWLIYKTCRPGHFKELFWQGMNQAIHLHRQPERYPVLLAKARRALTLLRADCEKHDATLVVVLIPAYDDYVDHRLPFRDHATMGPIVRAEINRRLRIDLAAELTHAGITVVDLFDVFQSADQPDLYAGDFHIWKQGHALLAQAVLPHVRQALEAGGASGDTESAETDTESASDRD